MEGGVGGLVEVEAALGELFEYAAFEHSAEDVAAGEVQGFQGLSGLWGVGRGLVEAAEDGVAFGDDGDGDDGGEDCGGHGGRVCAGLRSNVEGSFM